MIFRIFSPKFLAENFAFFANTTASFRYNLIITLFFEKTPIFSPEIGENRKKL
jgi:hypothetical protein